MNEENEKCECQMAGYCERRQTKVYPSHHARCQAGELRVLDRFYEKAKLNGDPLFSDAPLRPPVPAVSRIGTLLEAGLKKFSGHAIPCSDCLEEIRSLNRKTSEEVLEDADALAQRILARGQKMNLPWYAAVVAAHAPAIALIKLNSLIRRACDENDQTLAEAEAESGHGVSARAQS